MEDEEELSAFLKWLGIVTQADFNGDIEKSVTTLLTASLISLIDIGLIYGQGLASAAGL